MDEKTINSISNISETLLIPLYSRALESKTENPIIVDNPATSIETGIKKSWTVTKSFGKGIIKGIRKEKK